MTDLPECPRSSRWRTIERQRQHANGARSPRHGRVAYDDQELVINKSHRDCVDIQVHERLLDKKQQEADAYYTSSIDYKNQCLALIDERDDLKDRLEKALKQLASQPPPPPSSSSSKFQIDKLQRENHTLRDNVTIAATFLSDCGANNFDQLRQSWNLLNQKLEQTRGQLSRLQKEVLSAVDRFDPNYDASLVNKFRSLNTSIGLLTKSKDLKSVGLLSDPLATWDPLVFWPESVSPTLKTEKLTEGEKKLLFRQAIWKFLADVLFQRAKPFAAYEGEIVGELAANLPFEQLYPDHLTNESAGKWRSLTTRALSQLSSSSSPSPSSNLLSSFTSFLQSLCPTIPTSLFSTGKDLPKRLNSVLNEATEFSRLLNGERAGFEVISPCRLLKKGEEEGEGETEMTCLGAGVGVVDGPDVESEGKGKVKLVGSPMLVKWGNGGGQNLGERGVLVRGFVVLF
ncbi:hypothetical protein QBC38DRAFT_525652 [Podospora fimiseda]|uniref:Uncharacterized protein n=1 Tax=Podospora fimiseda TaxID=252190 RepID=A0AAN7H223_9PEZI|nr:hypothetical protein QBC38DRAFT_525652 [Podospora fimiseda]